MQKISSPPHNEQQQHENSSGRSSMSSMSSNYDQTTPLELGLVIDALQTTLNEQEKEDHGSCTGAQHDREHKNDSTQLDEVNSVSSAIDEGELATAVELHPMQRTETNEPTKKLSVFTSQSANLIVLDNIDAKSVKINALTPREQEKADEPVLDGIYHLFNNQFMTAKSIFERQARVDPLHALGIGSMVFFKAIMTSNHRVTNDAISVLMSTYTLANAQIDNATKKNVGDTVYQYFASYRNYIKFSRGTGVPTHVTPANPKALEMHKVDTIPNGILRAHVAKAEACLQMAILQLLQESVTGYIKCGLNLKRAYASYSIVWQEYKRMGQLHNEYIDSNTISGIQFGIGSVHLVLSSLPQKILRIVATFGWKADKHLGFALLKLCLEDRKARSTLASLMLLAYYTTLTGLCPQILSDEYTQPAIETLLDAQKVYPNSALFLYFAGRTSRLARNLTLSNQSFLYAIETSKNDWAEVEVLHMCYYEMGFNHMMQNEWKEASKVFNLLFQERYWSQAIFRYLTGACLEMMGQRTEAILAFAEVSHLLQKAFNANASTSSIEQYVLRKVKLFQSSGYQDMDMTMCALEYLYLFNAYAFMDNEQLEQNLGLVDNALTRILEAEKLEYSIRTRELLPETPPPEYNNQRSVLLLIKSSILNSMGRSRDSVIHLNWIIDRKDTVTADKWIVPYAYWEVGVTCWKLENKSRAREFWVKALGYSKYDFEYRLAMRVSSAIQKAEEMGIQKPITKKSFQSNANYDSKTKHEVDATSHEETQDVVYPEKIQDVVYPKKTNNDISVMKEPASDDLPEDMEQVIAQLNLGSSATN